MHNITELILAALTLASTVSAGEIAVSSLDLTKAVQGNWKAVANKSTVKGKPITLGGVVYTNGIGARTKYRLVIDCHGTAKRFKAIVGVNDEGDKRYDNVVFYVEDDGKLLWKSPIMKVGSSPATVDVDLTGVKKLVLWLRNGDVPGMGGDGPGDWANATITYDGEAPVTVDGTIPRKILTPAEPLTPRINGPRVFGARPGNPFQFYVPVTGQRPLKVTAEELPQGLSLDSATGIITGTAPAEGTYGVKLTATNARSSATRELKIVAGETLALTPPMGWNSWNFYNRRVTQAIMSTQTQAMAASGLRDHGYMYVNIDDFWEVQNKAEWDPLLHGVERDPATGRINSNQRFPDMQGFADECHRLGLKAGLYSSPGPTTCGGCVGSWQHEKEDAERFAEWGFDYLKYDWCSYNHVVKGDGRGKEYAKQPYAVMDKYLRVQKRDIVFSMCQYGMANVWEWASEVHGNTWRTTGDIGGSWGSMAGIGFQQGGHEPFVKPGCWNDPDMMTVGTMGHYSPLDDDEQYTEMSLWCIMAAPLILGCDLTKIDDFTHNLLCNDEVLEVNQDPLGRMGNCVATRGDIKVYAKEMSDGSLAVGLFNLGDETVSVSTIWAELKLTGPQFVRDLWRQQNLGKQTDGFTAEIPRHGVMLIRVSPAK
ncbi:MAG: NPCBM/NEW2 domain-containing protein [Planctomycetota bacterium]|nr:NPCBM/NEW2 domain-containing protein [Planctomycetota bacterium]